MSDLYAVFTTYSSNTPWKSAGNQGPELDSPFSDNLDPTSLFYVTSFGYSVEQTLNIGSQATGAGAGKISFHPMHFVRPIDKFSPKLFLMACSGTPFKYLDIYEAQPGSDGGQPSTVSVRRYGLTAVKEITAQSQNSDNSQYSTCEVVSFEHGQLTVEIPTAYDDSGHVSTWASGGWDRVKNVRLKT